MEAGEGGAAPPQAVAAAGTGAAAQTQPAGLPLKKLVTVEYADPSDAPALDISQLGGGLGRPLVVEALRPGGLAEREGIRKGCTLVSVDGRKEVTQLPGWQVRMTLQAPTTLVFDPDPVVPPVPKCSELRLARREATLGISTRLAVCKPEESGVLVEEVVCQPSTAALWLPACGKPVTKAALSGRLAAPASQPPSVYELRPREAHNLVGDALRGARGVLGSKWKPSLEPAVANPDPSAKAGVWKYFSLPWTSCECVADCVNGDEILDSDRWVDPADLASFQDAYPGIAAAALGEMCPAVLFQDALPGSGCDNAASEDSQRAAALVADALAHALKGKFDGPSACGGYDSPLAGMF